MLLSFRSVRILFVVSLVFMHDPDATRRLAKASSFTLLTSTLLFVFERRQIGSLVLSVIAVANLSGWHAIRGVFGFPC